MQDYLPRTDSELIVWMDNWVTVVGAAPTTYGLTAGQVTATGALVTAFKNGVANVETIKDSLKAAVNTKDGNRGTAVGDLRAKGRNIIASSTIADSAKLAAGYKIKDTTPTEVIPVAVTGLAVHGTSDGFNHLSWDRNGNKTGTDFNIEAQIGTSTAWVLVGHTRALKWNHEGQTPGVKVIYRIRSQRSSRFSGPSNEAIVYGS